MFNFYMFRTAITSPVNPLQLVSHLAAIAVNPLTPVAAPPSKPLLAPCDVGAGRVARGSTCKKKKDDNLKGSKYSFLRSTPLVCQQGELGHIKEDNHWLPHCLIL